MGVAGQASLVQCRVDGCFRIVDASIGYCPRHMDIKAKREARDKARSSKGWDRLHKRQEANGQRELYRTTRWRNLRKMILAANPLCTCGQPASQVHHIRMPEGNENSFFDPGNLASICNSCHLAESRRQRWAKWRAEP